MHVFVRIAMFVTRCRRLLEKAGFRHICPRVLTPLGGVNSPGSWVLICALKRRFRPHLLCGIHAILCWDPFYVSHKNIHGSEYKLHTRDCKEFLPTTLNQGKLASPRIIKTKRNQRDRATTPNSTPGWKCSIKMQAHGLIAILGLNGLKARKIGYASAKNSIRAKFYHYGGIS
ncbi:hypothetical protein Fot_32597 [Forsythia ovata]|uniref:Uncharacterized protein n=1 Tax=Forsythia ovata TaxID=205694 RepID=A0ABD1T897_9LAMI